MNSWVPNIYFANGQKKSYPQDYLDKLLKVGQNLNNNKLPVIFTLGHLSSITQIDDMILILKDNIKELNQSNVDIEKIIILKEKEKAGQDHNRRLNYGLR